MYVQSWDIYIDYDVTVLINVFQDFFSKVFAAKL